MCACETRDGSNSLLWTWGRARIRYMHMHMHMMHMHMHMHMHVHVHVHVRCMQHEARGCRVLASWVRGVERARVSDSTESVRTACAP